MTINIERDYNFITLNISGRLDSTTAPNLKKIICDVMPEVRELVIDVSELEFLSSAGIRVLLYAQKLMSKKEGMRIVGATNLTKDILEISKLGAVCENNEI